MQVFALEDEMAMMQSTVGSIMGSGKNKLMEQTLGGGAGGTADIMKLLGGSEGEDQTEVTCRLSGWAQAKKSWKSLALK